MSANTIVYVKVKRTTEEWIPVLSTTLDSAKLEAKRLPNVIEVVDAQYDDPEYNSR